VNLVIFCFISKDAKIYLFTTISYGRNNIFNVWIRTLKISTKLSRIFWT